MFKHPVPFSYLWDNAEEKRQSVQLNGQILFFLSCCQSVKEQEINHACFMPGGSSISLSDDGSLIPHRDINITDQSTA